jgi:hypothetical protein
VCFAPGRVGSGGGVGAGAHQVGANDGYILDYICTQARARDGMRARNQNAAPFGERLGERERMANNSRLRNSLTCMRTCWMAIT